MPKAKQNGIIGTERARRKAPRFTSPDPEDTTFDVEDVDHARDFYGMKSREAANGILVSAIHALGGNFKMYHNFIIALAEDIEPRDAVEAMLVTQMGATHVALAMASQRASEATGFAIRESYERSLTRLSRTYLAQMDALKRYRAKAQQLVRVERVDVRDGGQAIVGDVTHTGGRG